MPPEKVNVRLWSGWMQTTGWWMCKPLEFVEEIWFNWNFDDELTAHRFCRFAMGLWPHGNLMAVVSYSQGHWTYGGIALDDTVPNLSILEIESYLSRLELWINDNDATT